MSSDDIVTRLGDACRCFGKQCVACEAIDEIERLRSTRSTARLMADVIVLLRDQLPVGSDGRRWAEDALKAYQDSFGN